MLYWKRGLHLKETYFFSQTFLLHKAPCDLKSYFSEKYQEREAKMVMCFWEQNTMRYCWLGRKQHIRGKLWGPVPRVWGSPFGVIWILHFPLLLPSRSTNLSPGVPQFLVLVFGSIPHEAQMRPFFAFKLAGRDFCNTFQEGWCHEGLS